MGKAQVQPYPKGPNFETVWATLDRITKRQEEIDRIIKETDQIVKENARQMKETDRQIKDYNKRFGEFHNRFGEIVEYMVAPNLLKKFWEIGLKFNEATSDRDFSNDDYNISFEVDVFLENGEKAMLVEVKTKLTTEKVKEHVKRLGKMRTYADLKGDKRAFLGAVAGVVMTSNAKKYALAQGFYVIEPSGETFNITPPSQLKEW